MTPHPPALRQAQEFFGVARGLYRALGEAVWDVEEESALRLELGKRPGRASARPRLVLGERRSGTVPYHLRRDSTSA